MSKRIITLGTWDGKPIEWIVLKEESFGTLVLSKNILFSSKFDDSTNIWEKSYICKYLNNEFYSETFNKLEKTQIVNVKLGDTGKFKNNIILLNRNEAETLLDNEERSIGVWLLRTPWDGGSNNRILRVLNDGRLSLNNNGYDGSCDVPKVYGIRPAMYIREK